MNDYYTPHDLAREIGQSKRTARRVLSEAGIKHERGQWWRFDLDRPDERMTIEEVRAELARPKSKRRNGCRRRRRAKVKVRQLEMF